MKGCLQVIGGIVVFGVLLVTCAGLFGIRSFSQQPAPTNASHASEPRRTHIGSSASPVEDPCNSADELERSSSAALNANEYRTAYSRAVRGLVENDRCQNDDDQLVNEGYLLSIKGLAEHYLPEGDSRTDLNQADQLLVQCQTRPNLYGTHIAAQCETQEDNNIRATTNWEMNE